MTMTKRIVLIFAATLTLAAAGWAMPQQPQPKANLVGKPIMVTGKVSSVQQTAFVLDITKPKKDSLALFMDGNTTVDGDLKVNATADVTYQKDDQGNLVAVKVHVNP